MIWLNQDGIERDVMKLTVDLCVMELAIDLLDGCR